MFHIFHDIEIKSSASELFQIITTSDGLNSWWTTKSYGCPEIHSEYNFFFNESYNWFAQVIGVKKNKFVHYKMTIADPDWTNTILKFDILEKSNEIHILRFEHKNWKESNDHYRRTNFCWAIYFQKMKNLLENGQLL